MTEDEIKAAREIIAGPGVTCDPNAIERIDELIEIGCSALDEVERLQNGKDALRHVIRNLNDEIEQLSQKHAKECLEYASDYQKLRAENERLQAENKRLDFECVGTREEWQRQFDDYAELLKLRAENEELKRELGRI